MNKTENWRSVALHDNLRVRAMILAKIRQFFAERDVMEVETPLMCHATVTDPHVVGIPVLFNRLGCANETILYLQTSPEYAMKRLLAMQIGPIYQISKAFRQGEVGRIHNPEFTMLEWYRPGFDHSHLMDEVDVFLQTILHTPAADRISYADLFQQYFSINPHVADVEVLSACAKEKMIPIESNLPDRDAWLNLLWTHYIEPRVGHERPLFLYDFPVSQAALAKIRDEEFPVASRFEVYYKGMELANGFHELQDSAEQLRRFEKDLAQRKQRGQPVIEIDKRFIAALEHGLPDCAGIAMGIDRLVMLALDCKSIAEVITFTFENA